MSRARERKKRYSERKKRYLENDFNKVIKNGLYEIERIGKGFDDKSNNQQLIFDVVKSLIQSVLTANVDINQQNRLISEIEFAGAQAVGRAYNQPFTKMTAKYKKTYR